MELNEMKKELFYEPKHAMETVDEAVSSAATPGSVLTSVVVSTSVSIGTSSSSFVI